MALTPVNLFGYEWTDNRRTGRCKPAVLVGERPSSPTIQYITVAEL